MKEHANASDKVVLSKKAVIASILAVVLTLGMMVPITSASATPTSAEKRAEAQAALSQLEEMQTTLDQASANYGQALEAQKEAEAKVEEAKQKVAEETEKIQGLQEKLGNRARSMYRSGSTSFWDIILGAATFEEFANNFSMLDNINQADAELVKECKEARAALEAAQAEAEEQQKIAEQKAAEAKAVKDEAEATTAQMQETYNKLDAEAKELLEQEEAAAEAARQAAAQAAIAQGNSGGSSASGGGAVNNDKPQSVTGNIVVDRAYAQLGKPYVWGAVGPNSFDCSGLVGYCLTGRYSRLCTTYTMAGWTHVSNPRPGDLALNSHHTGVYIGNGQMIHAPRTGDVVKISAVHPDMYFVRY